MQFHGIITNGGSAPNIVPDYAKAKFYLRSATVPTMNALWPKVENIVAGAALMTGAKGRMQPYQNRVENTVPTPSFDKVYQRVMATLGVTVFEPDAHDELGSTDCGNISQVVPTIQPHISISEKAIPGHTEEFKAAACSAYGLATIARGAKALALTALELIQNPEELAAIKAEYAQKIAEQ